MENTNFEEERRFVETYLKKDRQKRLLYELTTPKKRYEGLDRFCHNSSKLIDMNKVVLQGDDLERQPEFFKFIKKHPEDCVILSPDSFIDGLTMALPQALKAAVESFDAVIILGDKYCLVYGEVEKGGREKYLLVSEQ